LDFDGAVESRKENPEPSPAAFPPPGAPGIIALAPVPIDANGSLVSVGAGDGDGVGPGAGALEKFPKSPKPSSPPEPLGTSFPRMPARISFWLFFFFFFVVVLLFSFLPEFEALSKSPNMSSPPEKAGDPPADTGTGSDEENAPNISSEAPPKPPDWLVFGDEPFFVKPARRSSSSPPSKPPEMLLLGEDPFF
jgi:hypothetical protein